MSDRSPPVPLDAPFDPETAARIRRKARRLVGRAGLQPQDRDDLEQDLALALIAARAQFDPERGAWGALAGRVLERTALNLVRYRRTGKRDDARLVPLTHEVPAASEGDRDLALDVAAALAALPPEQQALLASVVAHGIAAAARALGTTRTTVYARLRALQDVPEIAALAKNLAPPRDTSSAFGVIPR